MYAEERKKINDRYAVIACLVLAIACIAAFIFHVYKLSPLLDHGKRAVAVVTGFHRGVRGSKWAIYRFVTEKGEEISARDLFQMYIIRLDKGDEITVIYDPDNPATVTANFGILIWQGPVIFLSGFVLLTVLGFLIKKYSAGNKKNH